MKPRTEWTEELFAAIEKDYSRGLGLHDIAARHGVDRDVLQVQISRQRRSCGRFPSKGNKPGFTPWFPTLTRQAEDLWNQGETVADMAKKLGLRKTAVQGHINRERQKTGRFAERLHSAPHQAWTQEGIAALKYLHQQDLGYEQIGTAMGRTKASVSTKILELQQAGDLPLRSNPFGEEDVAFVARRLREGADRAQIASELGIAMATLKDHMARHNLQAQPHVHDRVVRSLMPLRDALAAEFPELAALGKRMGADPVSLLDGMLLGDSCISRGRSIDTTHYWVQAEYALAKYFGLWAAGIPARISLKKVRPGCRLPDVRFTSLDDGLVIAATARWYSTGKRQPPIDLELTSLCAALWYADDGYLQHHAVPGFATHSFAQSRVAALGEGLEETFGLAIGAPRRHAKGGYLLLCRDRRTAATFLSAVEPWIGGLKCLAKKFGADADTTRSARVITTLENFGYSAKSTPIGGDHVSP